jgi:putative SOS response-associated peptidase YedK
MVNPVLIGRALEPCMCGRYLIISSPDAIKRFFLYPELPNFPARYNVAPTQPVPIVRLFEGKRQFALVRWGLIPSWVKDPKGFSLLINARGESVTDKPAFRNAMKRRRCLFPADGFYEWMEAGGKKVPFAVRPKAGGPIAFAGLWECWMGPNGEELETAAIITTDANNALRDIHHRMPVVIPPDAFDFWLDPNVDALTAAALLTAPRDDFFEAYEISTAVNRVANDDPRLLEPLTAQPSAAAPVPEQPREIASAPAKRPRKAKKDEQQSSLF